MLRIKSDFNFRPTLIFACLFALFATVIANATHYRDALRLKPIDACLRLLTVKVGEIGHGRALVGPFTEADPSRSTLEAANAALESVLNPLETRLNFDRGLIALPNSEKPAEYQLERSLWRLGWGVKPQILVELEAGIPQREVEVTYYKNLQQAAQRLLAVNSLAQQKFNQHGDRVLDDLLYQWVSLIAGEFIARAIAPGLPSEFKEIAKTELVELNRVISQLEAIAQDSRPSLHIESELVRNFIRAGARARVQELAQLRAQHGKEPLNETTLKALTSLSVYSYLTSQQVLKVYEQLERQLALVDGLPQPSSRDLLLATTWVIETQEERIRREVYGNPRLRGDFLRVTQGLEGAAYKQALEDNAEIVQEMARDFSKGKRKAATIRRDVFSLFLFHMGTVIDLKRKLPGNINLSFEDVLVVVETAEERQELSLEEGMTELGLLFSRLRNQKLSNSALLQLYRAMRMNRKHHTEAIAVWNKVHSQGFENLGVELSDVSYAALAGLWLKHGEAVKPLFEQAVEAAREAMGAERVTAWKGEDYAELISFTEQYRHMPMGLLLKWVEKTSTLRQRDRVLRRSLSAIALLIESKWRDEDYPWAYGESGHLTTAELASVAHLPYLRVLTTVDYLAEENAQPSEPVSFWGSQSQP